MELTWQKTALIVAVLALFGVLAYTGKLGPETTTVGVSSILGWLAGLFTPTPQKKLDAIKSDEGTSK